MKQAVLVFAVALVITLAIGPAVINYLRKMKFGQKILEIGPKWQYSDYGRLYVHYRYRGGSHYRQYRDG